MKNLQVVVCFFIVAAVVVIVVVVNVFSFTIINMAKNWRRKKRTSVPVILDLTLLLLSIVYVEGE